MARKAKFPGRVYVAIHTGADGVEYLEAARRVEDIDVDRGTRIRVGVYDLKGDMFVRNQTTVVDKSLADKDVPHETKGTP